MAVEMGSRHVQHIGRGEAVEGPLVAAEVTGWTTGATATVAWVWAETDMVEVWRGTTG